MDGRVADTQAIIIHRRGFLVCETASIWNLSDTKNLSVSASWKLYKQGFFLKKKCYFIYFYYS